VGGTARGAAVEALRLASHKLPIRTKISVRPDFEGA
jgi:ribosomal protein L16/L10AE